MVTQTQLDANKRNSLKAGVKTDSGKEISKYNSIRHGVLRKTLIAAENDEAIVIRDELLTEYQPQTMTEYLLIESMILAYMRKVRAIQAEKAYLSDGVFPLVRFDQESDETSSIDASSYSVLDSRFMRYSTACDRQFYFALHELQRIQARRNGQHISSMAVDVINDKEE
ncbi:hypothetical protein LBMAG33_7750 [Candidatus Levyibacteriota bacterium]|nr:hypothetical protein LBMAG33_7750 [Candidatus Levybacteria bacterium]